MTDAPLDPARSTAVAAKLYQDLDRYLKGYRAPDRKPLTEGEVITALGALIAGHCKDEDTTKRWCSQVTIAALITHKENT